MAVALELNGIEKFNPNVSPTHLGQQWERWHRSFELFATGKGVSDPDQKRALLLHHAGIDVQDIYFTLTEEGEEDDDAYVICVKTLKKHFSPKVNVPYERYEFRSISQDSGETIEQFITKLRTKAVNCKFDNMDEAIRDQIIEKCNSHRLRIKLLEKGDALTLEQLCTIASTMELSEIQSNAIRDNVQATESKNTVNKVRGFSQKGPRFKKRQPSHLKKTCFRCGSPNHFAKDPSCPAKNKKCHKCQNVGHFQIQCRSKEVKNHGRQVNEPVNQRVEKDEVSRGYAFNIGACNLEKLQIKIGRIPLKVIIDSGSTANIIDQQTWNGLKLQNIETYSSRKTSRKLFAYGSSEPLNLLGEFESDISLHDESVTVTKVTFYVLKNNVPYILSRETARELGVLKVSDQKSSNVYSIKDEVMGNYKDCFQGLGKLKDYELKLHVDQNVSPVAQKMYPIPFSLKEKVSAKLGELESLDVIERVEGPTPWVSPVVVIPKPSGDIRICVDMRQANQAIIRERHPIQ